jgi:proline iminopeptidase
MILSRTTLAIALLALLALTGCPGGGESPPGGPDLSDGKEGSVSVLGARLSYRIEGEGPVVLAVGSPDYWPPTFSSDLRRHVKLIFVDCRIFVSLDPSASSDPLTLDTFVEDAERTRLALELDRFYVLGHSALGIVALEYARKHPEHVAGVIMIGTPYWNPNLEEETDEFWERDASPARKAALARNLTTTTEEMLQSMPRAQAIRRGYVAYGPMYWFDETYDADWLWEGLYVNADAFDRFFDEVLKSYEIEPTLGAVEAPVFAALGRYDYVVPYEAWERGRMNHPRLTYHLFERSGHYPMMEEAELFDERLLEWLKSTAAGS